MFRGLAFALIASVALSSSVLAGQNSGGAKKDATIKVNNDLSGTFAVVIDASDTLKSRLQQGTATLDDLNAAGGKILQPGKDGSFKVKAGSHRIGIASVSSSGSVGSASEFVRSVGKGKTLHVNISSLGGN